jgi:hypothetical protein
MCPWDTANGVAHQFQLNSELVNIIPIPIARITGNARVPFLRPPHPARATLAVLFRRGVHRRAAQDDRETEEILGAAALL